MMNSNLHYGGCPSIFCLNFKPSYSCFSVSLNCPIFLHAQTWNQNLSHSISLVTNMTNLNSSSSYLNCFALKFLHHIYIFLMLMLFFVISYFCHFIPQKNTTSNLIKFLSLLLNQRVSLNQLYSFLIFLRFILICYLITWRQMSG